MILNDANYFSPEMNWKYMSNSQYKDFAGSVGMRGCEAQAMAKLRGEWAQEVTIPMLVGSYVDAHFEGTLDVFKAQHPEIVKKDGGLRAEYKKAEEVIQRIERDELFMKFLEGKNQVIFTGEIFGAEWKCKIDSLDEDKRITDLKVMAELSKAHWTKDYGHLPFVQFWGYDIQAAIYQRLTEINIGKKLPFFIAGASKEKYPDIEVIGFSQSDLDDVLSLVKTNMERIIRLKKGELTPDRCGSCDYCRHTKVLSKPIHFSKLIFKV